MSDIYLSLTETPTVVTLSQPVVSGVLSSNVTVTNVVSVNVVTMPAITVQAAAPAVTTVAGTVSISNFPSTQTVAGTVTANDSGALSIVNSSTVTKADVKFTAIAGAYNASEFAPTYSLRPLSTNSGGTLLIDGNVAGSSILSYDGWAHVRVAQSPGSVVTVGSLPAISGTVTIGALNVWDEGNQDYSVVRGFSVGDLGSALQVVGCDETNLINGRPSLPVAGTVTVGNSVTIGSLPAISGTVTARLQDASGNNLTSTSIGGLQRLNVSLASAATPGGSLPSFVNVYGGSDSGTVRALAVDSSGRTVVTVSNFPSTQAVSLASTTVTVSALPSGALTTRFGSVTTANTAQITSAVTNTSRKYLLAQNISAGTVTIGIGFSPTTTQGIQLTAGGGLTFDAFCPTGAVYWLGAVTGAAWTILEG